MGLRDKYQTQDATPTGTPLSTGASVIPTDPASELAQLRAKLAGRGNVNPPEASIPDDAMVRTTRETADGGAELIAPATAEMASEAAASPPAESATPRKPRSKKPPAAAEAPIAAGVEAAPLDRIATALEALVAVLRARE